MDTSSRSELNTRIRQQEVVAELGQQALEEDDLDQLMHDASVAVAETLDNEYCKVLELLPGGDEVFLRHGVGWQEGYIGNATVPTDLDSQAGYTLISEEPIIVDDLETESRFSGPDLLIDHDVVSGISVIIGSVEEPWGVLGTHTTERREFTEHDANFVQNVANVLASAIESEQVHSELEEMYSRISDAFFALDEEWRFTHLNEHAHEVINPESQTLIGKNIWEMFPEAIGRKFKEKYEQAIYEQETVAFEEYYPEPLDAWFEVRAYPSETGLSVYFSDVTDRKEHERQLEESERRYRTLAEYFPNGIVTPFDHDLQYELAAGQAFEDIPVEPADVEGYHFSDVWDDTTTDALQPVFEAALDGEERSIELEYAGREWILHAVPITDERGDVFAGMTMVQDITERKEHQRRLERYKQYTDDILNAVDDVFYVIDDAGDLRRWNDSVCEVTGYSEAKIKSMSALDFFDEDTDRIANAIAEGFETGSVLVEATICTKDGESIPYEFAAAMLEDSEGDPVLAGIGRDITDRKDREQELAKYETIVETINDGIYVKDEDGYFTMVNDAYAEFTGYDRAELVGEHASLVVDEETIEQSRERRTETVDGEAIDPTMEATIQRADGGTVPTEGSFATIQTGDGDQKRVGVVRDVTERVERERQLEESERRYRTLAEHFPNGAVGVYDHDLRYTLTEGAVLGDRLPSADRLEGDRVPDIFPPDTVEDLEPLFRAAVEDGATDSTMTEFGGRHWRVWATPLHDADGEIFAGLSFTQDITEQVGRQQRLEELVDKLEESNERLEQFAYAASHDLQEPLRMVSSYLRLIEQRYADELDADGEEFLEFAVDGADRMRGMIDGLLQYSRVDTHGDSFEPVDLSGVLTDVREDLQVRIEESDADITADSLPRVGGDEGQLRQVFQNLLSNAIEYSGDEPPQIHISAERDGDEWMISVSDEGIGIEPDDVDRVFEVFQSLHTREEHSGTGIGLALCERIIERHGGNIWVESEPGEGATFSFTLPVTSDHDE